jgi:hypothetical protein
MAERISVINHCDKAFIILIIAIARIENLQFQEIILSESKETIRNYGQNLSVVKVSGSALLP